MAALEGMLTYEDGMVVETAVNILHSVAEFNSSTVRDHILQTAESVNEVKMDNKSKVIKMMGIRSNAGVNLCVFLKCYFLCSRTTIS